MQPLYAVVILSDGDQRLLFERRPPCAAHAAGRLTCFGGRIEAGETAGVAARRELAEELGWRPASLRFAIDFHRDGVFVARFFQAVLPCAASSIRTPLGNPARAVAVPLGRLEQAPLSRWHRAVLVAWRGGKARCVLNPGCQG